MQFSLLYLLSINLTVLNVTRESPENWLEGTEKKNEQCALP